MVRMARDTDRKLSENATVRSGLLAREEPLTMNWEMLAAIGQLAAVVIGIPSLIYLALQIRAQTKERRQSAVNVLTVQWGDLTYALHDNAEFGAIGKAIVSCQRVCCRDGVFVHVDANDGATSLGGDSERRPTRAARYIQQALAGRKLK